MGGGGGGGVPPYPVYLPPTLPRPLSALMTYTFTRRCCPADAYGNPNRCLCGLSHHGPWMSEQPFPQPFRGHMAWGWWDLYIIIGGKPEKCPLGLGLLPTPPRPVLCCFPPVYRRTLGEYHEFDGSESVQLLGLAGDSVR